MKAICSLFVLLVGLLLTGCQTHERGVLGKTVFLPDPSSGEQQAYKIRRTNEVTEAVLIKIQVKGQVKRPGVVRLPAGSSALEALLEAGGVARTGSAGQIDLIRTGAVYKLILQRKGWRANHYFAWYEVGAGTGLDRAVTQQTGSDFALLDGDQLVVPRWTAWDF